MESAEHTLEHWDLFQTYLKLYEDTLNEWLEREGVENAQFYKDVQHVQDCVEIKILRRVRAESRLLDGVAMPEFLTARPS